MKANFQLLPLPVDLPPGVEPSDAWTADDHFKWLAFHNNSWGTIDSGRIPPEGYENYTCIDVGGKTLEWLNKSFPADKFTWYVWFESIFLIPDNMLTFLRLKWL